MPKKPRQPAVSAPAVSVVIPAYNAARTIGKCLEAITRQDFGQGRGKGAGNGGKGAGKRYEVIVVNDGSKDNTAAAVRKFRGVKLLNQENAGPASARNRGAGAATGGIIVFMDSDCVANGNFLREMAKPFSDGGVSGVQGAYLGSHGGLMERFGQLEIEQRYEKMKMQKYIDFIGSYAAAYRTGVFRKFGGFDESFLVASGEDTDLSFRISSAGHKFVFNPKATVRHFHPASLPRYLKVKFFRGHWRVLVYWKHRSKVLADSYTSQTIKIQVALFYFAVICGFYTAAAPKAAPVFALTAALLLLTTMRFFLFALPRDRGVAVAGIGIQLLRTGAFCAGLIYGALKLVFGRM